jgi:hypothetical protein
MKGKPRQRSTCRRACIPSDPPDRLADGQVRSGRSRPVERDRVSRSLGPALRRRLARSDLHGRQKILLTAAVYLRTVRVLRCRRFPPTLISLPQSITRTQSLHASGKTCNKLRCEYFAIERGMPRQRKIFWLVLTVAMTGLFWVPYILNRIMVRGLVGAMANPSPTEKRSRRGPSA